MIIDSTHAPVRYMQYDAMRQRLSKELFEPYLSDFKSYKSGQKGEEKFKFHAKDILPKGMTILYDLRLELNGDHFQIEALLLAPTFMLVLEIKNFTGSLVIYPDSHHMQRTYEGEITTFGDPLDQARLHAKKLSIWLAKNHIQHAPKLPIYPQVIFTNEKTPYSIEQASSNMHHYYARPPILFRKIQQLSNQKAAHTITPTQMSYIAKKLRAATVPVQPDYKLCKDIKYSLISGVRCEVCENKRMEYLPRSGTWRCEKCGIKDKSSYKKAVFHYALLIADRATNEEMRRFLNVSSRRAMLRLFKELELPLFGKNRSSYYCLKQTFKKDWLTKP